MTSTELATVAQSQQQGTLALQSDQTWWTERQAAALQQMGVSRAGNGDLLVFLHVSQKTGLDPFARQIYMIERAGKQTIQTGIDGFRLIARRAADRAGEALEYEDTLWADSEGNWTDLWTKGTAPTAAKVTIFRDGRKFSAVAMYREYVQTKSSGDPNAMWSRMPANQLAKCAEALVLRKAFPQDLSGIYTDDEMGQADRTSAEPPAATQGSGAQRMAAVLHTPVAEPERAPTDISAAPEVPDPVDPDPADATGATLDMRSTLARRLFAVMGEAGFKDEDQHAYLSKVLGRQITSRKDLTPEDAQLVITATEAALAEPFPQDRP